MKKLLIFLTVVMMTGCANFGSNQSYLRYLDAKKAQVQAERQPVLDLQLDEEGRLASIKMYPQPRNILIEQEKDHPIYALTAGLIKVAGVVGVVWQVGEGIEDIVEASNGDTTYINSANNNSENAGSIELQGDYATSRVEELTSDIDASSEE